MKIQYLTNIYDPILKTDKKYRKHIRSLLVSEVYSSRFNNSDNKSDDFDFLLSDNGNFTRLTKIANRYKARAKEISDALGRLEKDKKPIPLSLKKKRKALNDEIIFACKEAAKKDFSKITARQLAINPHAIIGGEDTTIPVLQICGAFDRRLKNKVPSLLPFQKRTLNLYSRQYNGEFGGSAQLEKTVKYLVIHAVDYEDVVNALKNAKKINFDAIAISLGAPLKSNRYLASISINNASESFAANTHPESYILSIVLLLALRVSLNKKTPIHILGLGSPILILLAGYMFRDFKFVTIDSTSTYTDDLEKNKVFDISKMDLFKLAASCVVTGRPFKGKSPYFKSFEKAYKPKWQKLFQHFRSTTESKLIDAKEKRKKIELELKANPYLLKNTVPFLTPIAIADKTAVKELRIARAFENYSANNRICKKMSSLRTVGQINEYVNNEIAKYRRVSDVQYYDAVCECKRIIDKFGNGN